MDGFRLIEIRGDAFERGQQHGEQTADLIRANLEGYWRLFEHDVGLDRTAVLDQARQYAHPGAATEARLQ